MGTALSMLLAAFLSAGREPPAPEPEVAPARPGPSPIEISGFVDTYYGYNFNRPPGDTQLRNFDTKHDQLSLNLIEVALEQRPTAESRLGFRADLDFGPATDLVHAAEPGGADVFKTFQQGYLSWLAPVGRGVQLDVGKFVTPHGAEVIEAGGNWNYSRSLLFALAIPYYHVGVRASYSLGDTASLAGFFVNGWNNGVENNGGKTFGVQATVKPHATVAIVQNLMAGPEQAGDSSRRFLSDTTVTWTPSPRLSLMANYDHGRDSLAGAPVRWNGLAAYARFQIMPAWVVAPRVEILRDRDGFLTGTAQTVKELTLTSEHTVAGALLARIEYRRDFSDREFFARRQGSSRVQNTLALGLVYRFSSAL